MARPATGQVIERKTKRGTSYAIRFRALGSRQFVTLGTTAEGWNRPRAEEELANVLADVRRGIWRPARPAQEEPEAIATPDFGAFASEWYEQGSPGW